VLIGLRPLPEVSWSPAASDRWRRLASVALIGSIVPTTCGGHRGAPLELPVAERRRI
jgi:hypothetical protein